MPRGLTSTQIAALQSRVKGVAYFFKLDLPTGSVALWTGFGYTYQLGHTWQGLGEFMQVGYVGSTVSQRSQQVQIGLEGVPAEYLNAGAVQATRGVRYQGAGATIYLGITDVRSGLPVAAPTPVWAGFADVMTWQLGEPNSVTCILTCEHIDSQLRRTNGWAMTTASHNARLGYPPIADRFFDVQTSIMAAPRGTFG